MTLLGLFLNNELRTGGHTRYLDLMERLADRGHRVLVVLNDLLDYRPRSFEVLRTRVSYVRRGFPPASLLFRRAVAGLLPALGARAGGLDAIVVFGETHLAAAALLKRALCVPVLYSHRSNAVRENLISIGENLRRPWALPPILWDAIRAGRNEGVIGRVADLIVFQSSYDLADFTGRRPRARDRSSVVRGDIRSPRFRPECAESNRSTSMRRVLFVGNFGERKGVAYFLRAISLLHDTGLLELKVDVAGRGAEREAWEGYVRERGLQTIVSFLGRVADPFPLMAAADLVVVPSLFDSYPNVVLEALHVGTPVIGSRVGGIPDMLQHDELLFPPADEQAIADRIATFHRHPAAYARAAELCRGRRAYFDFDWAAEFEKLLARLCQPRPMPEPSRS